jgi:hypothetical protein
MNFNSELVILMTCIISSKSKKSKVKHSQNIGLLVLEYPIYNDSSGLENQQRWEIVVLTTCHLYTDNCLFVSSDKLT